MKLKVFRLREDAKLPLRAYPTDAGMDLFYSPADGYNSFGGSRDIHLGASQGALIPTGLKIAVPKGHMLEIKNKSGVAFKKRLIVGACVVDSGYNGEVFVNLNNIGDRVAVIKPGQKIAQAVLIPIKTCAVEEVSDDNVYGTSTLRGAGSLGSTGEY